MKFYDKGFIYKYKDYTQVQIFSAGTAVLDMKIYEDKICRTTFKCQDLETFNKENLVSTYPNNFLKELFEIDSNTGDYYKLKEKPTSKALF